MRKAVGQRSTELQAASRSIILVFLGWSNRQARYSAATDANGSSFRAPRSISTLMTEATFGWLVVTVG
ncbi:MAG: hypothetical protein IPG58_18280 [Acidobacteria bacterium]|nr:hypothetical protein [Acidobacteriota bacterium]